jgi:hypothetical protein
MCNGGVERFLGGLFERLQFMDEAAHEKSTVITDNFCHGYIRLNTQI